MKRLLAWPRRTEKGLGNGDIDRGLEGRELGILGQPVVALGSGTVLGAEVFARWHHPDRGELKPNDFLPAFDSQGRGGELTRFVIDEALAWLTSWRCAGREWDVSVNLGPADLLDPTIVSAIHMRLLAREVSARALCLELALPFLARGPLRALATYRELDGLGVRIAFDGAPIAAPAFAALEPPPDSILKIHRDHIPGLGTEVDLRESAAIAELVATARAAGVRTTAVGVESSEELDAVEALGFDAAQGHFICPPAPYAAIEAWLGMWVAEPVAPAMLLRPDMPMRAPVENSVRAMHERLARIFAAGTERSPTAEEIFEETRAGTQGRTAGSGTV